MNLKQLSHMLSLSQTTVSRALNGYPEVSEETRRRVVDAAKRNASRPAFDANPSSPLSPAPVSHAAVTPTVSTP